MNNFYLSSDDFNKWTELKLFNLKKAALIFLDKFHFLEQIKTACQNYSAKPDQMLYLFDIFVDVIDLMEENVELCNLILNQPMDCQDLFKEVIYKAIITLKWLRQLENIGQILVTVRVTRLPPFSEYRIDNFGDLLKHDCLKYYKFDGIVIAQTVLASFTQGACYQCPNSICPGATGYKFTRTHIPGDQERQIVRNDFKCIFCGQLLKENVAARVLSEKLIAEMVPVSSFHPSTTCIRYQAVPVYFRGGQAKNVKLGHAYSVTALLVCKYMYSLIGKESYLEANFLTNYEANIQRSSSSFLTVFHAKINRMLMQLGLHEASSSPYIYPLILSYYFGEHIVPKGLFIKLKLGILLALTTYNNTSQSSEKANMSILVVGSNTTVINHLLTYGSELAPRVTVVTDQCQLKVLVRRDSYVSGLSLIEGNPLLLATGGVCYFGDLVKFNNTAKSAIANILETGSVLVDSVKDNNYPGLVEALPKSYSFECQVWAYSSQLRQQNNWRMAFQNSRTASLPKHLLDAFSIVYHTDSSSASENLQKDMQMMDGILSDAMSRENCNHSTVFTLEEFQTVLKILQQQKVHFEMEAESLIQSYYVASRSNRSSKQHDTELSITAVTALSLIAEAHAKLSFRSTVTESDAVAAIFLYEEYLTSRYGTSYFMFQPVAHLLTQNKMEDFKMLLDQYETFSSNLHNFVSGYSKDCISDKPEE